MNKLAVVTSLLEQGLYLFPLSPNTKIPAIKGGNGWYDATNDLEIWKRWIDEYGEDVNIGLNLKLSNIIAIDLDAHSDEYTGMQALTKLFDITSYDPEKTLSKSYREDSTTINSNGVRGMHLFYKYTYTGKESDFKGEQYGFKGIEILTNSVTIAPSVINEKSYEPYDENLTKPWLNLVPAPQMVIDYVNNINLPKISKSTHKSKQTGMRLSFDEYKEQLGVINAGGRNNEMASIVGKLLSYNLHYLKTIYTVL